MIKSNRLPNLHNLGVNLRILVIVNSLLALAALVLSKNLSEFSNTIANVYVLALPMLLLSLLLLYTTYSLLCKLNYWLGVLAILLITLFASSAGYGLISRLLIFPDLPSYPRALLFVVMVVVISLCYFDLQQRALSPAIDEARLQALQARIRPHFLFNCINAVLSIMRSQPKQAETALEDMADLFRVLMADNLELVGLAEEIALCRKYLALEKLRLEERLTIQWLIDDMPPDALIPPLVLQPLIENAVYHGIEPLATGGIITIQIYTQGKQVHIVLTNPYQPAKPRHIGNKIALNNIKERLNLHFDLEAALKSTQSNGEYQVHIILPYSTR